MNEKFRSVISHSSDDKVKICYSWFGPRGPVWNTELPNLLALAAEAEGVNPNMHSRNFWSDDIWHKQFSKAKDKYELAPIQAIEADDLKPFVYPYGMTWRVEFQKYFLTKSGLLEFSHMPPWLIHMVSTRNGYILIDHSVEAFMSDTELNAMFSYFHKGHQIPMYKIIYLTGTINATKVYEDFCEKFNVPEDRTHRMHVIPYASSREIFHNFYKNGLNKDQPDEVFDEPIYNDTEVPPKVFLSWNRRFREHRISLALVLEKNNLIDKCMISFAKIDGETSSKTVRDEIDSLRPYQNSNTTDNLIRLYHNHLLYIEEEVVERFYQRCPMEIDGETNINRMCEDAGYTQDYYKNTLVSLVTETNYNVNECTLTEKSFKPMFNKHPFIIIGVPGSIQGLRDLGFQTFSDFWSEAYDNIDDPSLRLLAIEGILIKIASWTTDEILDFKRRVKPIVEHNYHMFKEPGSVAVVNNIYEHITDNFNTDYTHWCSSTGRCHFE